MNHPKNWRANQVGLYRRGEQRTELRLQGDWTLHPAAPQPCHAMGTQPRCKYMQTNHSAHSRAAGQYFLPGSLSRNLFCIFLCPTSVFNPFRAPACQSQPSLIPSWALRAATIRSTTHSHAQPPAARGARRQFTAEESYVFAKKFLLF